MKVLIFGTGTLDCAAANCGIALRAMGHQVRHFDPDLHPGYLARVRRTWTGKKIVNRLLEVGAMHARTWCNAFYADAEAFGPDLVLITPLTVVPAYVVGEVKRRTGAHIAAWFQDAVVNFGGHDFLLADYDALFFKDRYIVERLKDYCGLSNVHYLPEACEPRVHRPVPLTASDIARFGCDLMTYGSAYPYRARLLESLLDRDLKYYADHPGRWVRHEFVKKWQGFGVYWNDKAKAVLAAKIVLNTSHFGEVRSANARTFEVAGIGGFQVADAPGISDFFEPGKEIVTFRGPKQLNEVVNHYLNCPEERARIAAAARARAYRDHTYELRLDILLRTIGLGRPMNHEAVASV